MNEVTMPVLRREIRRYRGVPYEHWTYFPEGVETQIRGDHPGLARARSLAAESVGRGRQWADWLVECARCGHTEREHGRERRDPHSSDGVCGFALDHHDEPDWWGTDYCPCERYVRRAPLVVVKGALSEPSRVA